jgi:hypothetical protein
MHRCTNLLQQRAALILRQHRSGKLGRAEAHVALGAAAGLKRALHPRACSGYVPRIWGLLGAMKHHGSRRRGWGAACTQHGAAKLWESSP